MTSGVAIGDIVLNNNILNYNPEHPRQRFRRLAAKRNSRLRQHGFTQSQ